MIGNGANGMLQKICDEIFYSEEAKDDLPYFDDSELMTFARRELSDEQYGEFEALLSDFAGEVAYYWWNRGAMSMRRMINEIFRFEEKIAKDGGDEAL